MDKELFKQMLEECLEENMVVKVALSSDDGSVTAKVSLYFDGDLLDFDADSVVVFDE